MYWDGEQQCTRDTETEQGPPLVITDHQLLDQLQISRASLSILLIFISWTNCGHWEKAMRWIPDSKLFPVDSLPQCLTVCYCVLLCASMCYSVLLCVTVCYSVCYCVIQCLTVCCCGQVGTVCYIHGHRTGNRRTDWVFSWIAAQCPIIECHLNFQCCTELKSLSRVLKRKIASSSLYTVTIHIAL